MPEQDLGATVERLSAAVRSLEQRMAELAPHLSPPKEGVPPFASIVCNSWSVSPDEAPATPLPSPGAAHH